MKLFNTTPLVIVAAAVVLTSIASAQAPVQNGNLGNPGAIGQGKFGKGHGKRNHKNVTEENKYMVQAMKQCRMALKEMEHALPIYQGRRANAIGNTKMAIDEIQIGIISSRNNGTPGNQTAKTQSQVADAASKKQYSAQQIQASQKKMTVAVTHLQNAYNLLNEAQPDFGGHRASAITDVQRAIQLAQEGINLVSSGR